ncbi:MAG: MFS transporter [Dehalococcoidia bacterium]|nr:MFS transporter [Dehalococcoidia bacterium]
MSNMMSSFRYSAFRYLWLGQVTHAAGMWIDMVTIPLIVLSLYESLEQAAINIGLVMFVRTMPHFTLGLFAGVFADNFNRKTLLVVTKIGVVFIQIIFMFVVFMDHLSMTWVYLYTFFRGATMAFDQPARRAMIANVVPQELYTNAMALSMGTVQATRIIAAAGAGWIIALTSGVDRITEADYGFQFPVTIILILYTLAFIFTYLINYSHEVINNEGENKKTIQYVFAELIEGLRFSWSRKDIRAVVIMAACFFLFGMVFMQVFAPLFAKILGIGEKGLGILLSMSGIGGASGAVFLAAVNPNNKRGIWILSSQIALGLSLILFALSVAFDNMMVIYFMAILIGLSQAIIFPLINSVLMKLTPDHLRGRAMGLLSLDRAFVSLGAAIAGPAAAYVGVTNGQILFGVGCVMSGIFLWIFGSTLRKLD